MISEMLTRVPGPCSKEIHATKIIWSDRLEKTNIWDVDGNRFLDLTSGGGLLPFGYVAEGLAPMSEVQADFSGYTVGLLDEVALKRKAVLKVGKTITTAFSEPSENDFITLAELAKHEGEKIDFLLVQAEYIEPLELKNIASWCRQFNVRWIADERDLGMFRTGVPYVAATLPESARPDFILSQIASEDMSSQQLCWRRDPRSADFSTKIALDEILVAKNYTDLDLTRTNHLQALELSGLLKETILDKEIGCVGAFHSIDLVDEAEVLRVAEGLLQRGIIVASMGSKIILLPSLYLALGEIVFAVNHLRLVISDINEMETPWVTESLRDNT